MTVKHKVLKLLDKPKKAFMMLGDVKIEYWEVKVLMGCKGLVYESLATFSSENDANKLRVGDILER